MSAINGEDKAQVPQWLFGVAVEEGWVQSNPFFELTKRVRGRAKKKEAVLLDQGDKDWTKLPQHLQLLWHVLRWTGSHASEAAGLRWEDIDSYQNKSHEGIGLTTFLRCLTASGLNERSGLDLSLPPMG